MTSRILLIHETRLFRRALTNVLGDDYAVTETNAIDAALTVIGPGARFDAILCAERPTISSARELYDRLLPRAIDQASRIVVLGDTRREIEDEGFRAALGKRYIPAPFHLPTLLATLARVCARSQVPLQTAA